MLALPSREVWIPQYTISHSDGGKKTYEYVHTTLCRSCSNNIRMKVKVTHLSEERYQRWKDKERNNATTTKPVYNLFADLGLDSIHSLCQDCQNAAASKFVAS